MTCTEFDDLVVVGIHGRLNAEERAWIDRHRAVCARCAAIYERYESSIDLQAEGLESAESLPMPDWQASWEAIAVRALPEMSPFARLVARLPRWVPVTAAILLVFVLGTFFGRGLLFDAGRPKPGAMALSTPEIGTALDFTSYADNLKPVLMNFLNRGDVAPPDELRALEREIIGGMLSQTRILRGLAAKTGDAELADLLFDLEFILTSMANLAPGDEASAAHLERMIRDRDVSLRLRELASPATI